MYATTKLRIFGAPGLNKYLLKGTYQLGNFWLIGIAQFNQPIELFMSLPDIKLSGFRNERANQEIQEFIYWLSVITGECITPLNDFEGIEESSGKLSEKIETPFIDPDYEKLNELNFSGSFQKHLDLIKKRDIGLPSNYKELFNNFCNAPKNSKEKILKAAAVFREAKRLSQMGEGKFMGGYFSYANILLCIVIEILRPSQKIGKCECCKFPLYDKRFRDRFKGLVKQYIPGCDAELIVDKYKMDEKRNKTVHKGLLFAVEQYGLSLGPITENEKKQVEFYCAYVRFEQCVRKLLIQILANMKDNGSIF